MEGKRDHRVRIAALLLIVAALTIVPGEIATAEDPPFDWDTTITVETDDDGVTVDAENEGSQPGAEGGGGGSGSGSQPRCHLEEIKSSEWDDYIELEYWARRMQYAPYNLYCDGEWVSIVWIEIVLDEGGLPLSPPADPREVAERLRDQMPVPRSSVEINPDRGVVGVESWFWIDGYDGSVLTNSTDAFGWLVEVQARASRYEWSFGDGSTLTGTAPGRTYPERSQVRHAYERSSAGFPAGYPVQVTYVFQVRYRVDGGSWTALPGISRTAEADYSVRESQAVIQR